MYFPQCATILEKEKKRFSNSDNVNLAKIILWNSISTSFRAMLLICSQNNTYSLLPTPRGTWVTSVRMEVVCIWCYVRVQHINRVGKPINLFMSVLSGLCDLSARGVLECI